ncbi:MAG: F0F1 ATP synthase subunit epsilon [Phycisphaerae bacterium]|nr:F0F1 ATP synthase subunit epsilon [Phycisphaerae bacterium]
MTDSPNIFRCVIISPAGKLLDCSAICATFIAHDGSVGVMSNHMPMLCELGLGIMAIEPAQTETKTDRKKFALIDGGFALIHSNMVNIIAADAVISWDTKKEKIEYLIERSKKKLKGVSEVSEQYSHQVEKNALLEKLLSNMD